MRLLLDTHMLLWAAEVGGAEPRRELPGEAAALIESAEAVLFSVVSVWEVAIKHAAGKAAFRVEPERFRWGLLDAGYEELVITAAHAIAAGGLPPVHRDPFDRLLVAQAGVEGVVLLTSDAVMGRYGGVARIV